MKKIIFALFIIHSLFFITNCNAQQGWGVQICPTSNNLMDVFFINTQTGWACGASGTIIKTTNGGVNWNIQSTPTTITLRAIRFCDSNYGYSVGGDDDQNPFCQDLNVILKTTNGGVNWIYPPTLTNPDDIYYDVTVLNKDTAFVTYAGSDLSCYNTSGGTYRTFNGGINWTQFGGGGHMKGISFINSCTGWTAIYAASASPMFETYYFYKTTNTGLNWTLIYSDSTMDWHTGKIRFVDENTGYCYKKILRKTTNSGYNWQSIDSVTTNNMGGFSLANKDTLWILKGFYVFRTNNSGVNWTQQLTAGVGLNSIFFLDKNTGWTAGNGGIIYKTVTGGVGNEDYAAYFPMHTGDFFVYYAWYWPYPNIGSRFKARITKDTIMNGHKYFYLTNFPDIGTGWVRYDSTRTNLLYYYPNANCSGYVNDKIIDSLSAEMNNQVNSCVYHWSYTRCEDTAYFTLFNNYNVKTKSFRHDGLALAHTRYAKNFGILSFDVGEPPPSEYFVSLTGCYINGVSYGDTLLTNVSQISTEIPKSFSLNQNYPNPFNPVTKIKFDIPGAVKGKTSYVKLIIYDITGREIQTLVNEKLNPGTYEVTFDGSNLPSGVYFYQLRAGDFVNTKKLILLK